MLLLSVAMYAQGIDPNVEIANPNSGTVNRNLNESYETLQNAKKDIYNQSPISFNTAKRGSATARTIDLANAENATGPEKYALQQSATSRDTDRLSGISEAEYNADQQRKAQRAQQLLGVSGQEMNLANTRNNLGEKQREVSMFYQDLMARKQAARDNFLKTGVEAGLL